MKMKNIALLLATVGVIVVACTKEDSPSHLSIRLTDAPADYEEVNVDLKAVNIKFGKDSSKWVNMEVIPGIYNLLELQNGVDTLIAQGTYSTSDVIKEIRLVLGTENTIVANGQEFPLVVPSGSESGLKLKVNKELNATMETLIVDFDAALSVKEESGSYKLDPVLRIK